MTVTWYKGFAYMGVLWKTKSELTTQVLPLKILIIDYIKAYVDGYWDGYA